MVTMERDVEQGNKCSHVKSQCICSLNTLIERTRYYIAPSTRVNNIRREYLTPYRAVKYDCVKLKGFPCDV